MTAPLSKTAGAVLDWYWAYGMHRTGDYDLSGGWLDRLYQVRDAATAAEAVRVAGRPCMALWGPSQSGKSTLLSRYLDSPTDAQAVSALQWDPAEPVAFVGRADKPDCIHLNPFNLGKDASGC